MKFLSFIFFLIKAINLLDETVEGLETESIRGGTPIIRNERYTYHASLHRNSRYKCGAGLVHDKFAITTAHCLINTTTGDYFSGFFTIVAGAINISNRAEPRYEDHVRKIYTHKTYTPASIYSHYSNSFRSDGDIALLKLQTGFDLSNNPRLSKLVISDYISYLYHILFITGYGYNEVIKITDPFSTSFIDVGIGGGPLRYAESQVIEDSHCMPYHDHYMTANHICARTLQRRANVAEGVCMGDDGSPLVYDHKVLVGILIVGPADCNENDQPAIYLNVSYYSRFINDALAEKKTSEMRVASWRKRWGCASMYEYIDE